MADHPGGPYYAFLYQDETVSPKGPALLRMEALPAEWFDARWSELRTDPLVARVEDVLRGWEGRDPREMIDALGYGPRASLYDVHREYGDILLDLAPPVAIIEMMVDEETSRRMRLRTGVWYRVVLGPGTRLAPLRNPEVAGEAILGELALRPEDDPPPTRHQVEGFEELRVSCDQVPIGPILAALHLPQTPPEDEDEWPVEVFAADVDEGGRLRRHRTIPADEPVERDSRCVTEQRRKFASCEDEPCSCRLDFAWSRIPRSRRRRWASAAMPAGLGGEALASAPLTSKIRVGGVFGMAAPAVDASLISPTAAGTTVAQFQPIVAANAVGAGNNIGIWDAAGQLTAYVDYGYPVPMNKDTFPTAAPPCVCSDPLVILTHWDYDHFAMVRQERGALGLRWIAPRQQFGSVAMRELYVPLLRSAARGGRLYLWEKKDGHLATDFGLIGRAKGNTVNDDGLVVWVRADVPTGGTPAGAAPVRSRNLPLIFDSAVPGEWIDATVSPPFTGREVVVPTDAGGDFAARAVEPLAGEVVTLPNGISAHWVPEEGVPCAGGGSYVPSGDCGGWAISAENYVEAGGVVLDFPGPGTGHDGTVVVCSKGAAEGEGALETPDGGTWKSEAGYGHEWLPIVTALRLGVEEGEPPFDADAAYVLLPGDAGYDWIPADGVGVTPRVIGMVASHHGSATWLPRSRKKRTLAEAAVPAGRQSGCEQIVYSYGTGLDPHTLGRHCYARPGHEGHPHTRVINVYKRRGWGSTNPCYAAPFTRLNTAPEDFQSLQRSDPLGIATTSPTHAAAIANGHRSGNVAIGWDLATGGPLRGDHGLPYSSAPKSPGPGLAPPIRRGCQCGKARDYYF